MDIYKLKYIPTELPLTAPDVRTLKNKLPPNISCYVSCKFLWRLDQPLGNDHEISNITAAVAK
jgi:hypothetical protein